MPSNVHKFVNIVAAKELYPKVENMYSVAKSELFKNKLIAKFLTYHNAFPIERNKTDIKGVKSILEGGIFKENYKYNKRKTKSGAVYLSAITNVPIIPVHITVRPKFFSTVTVTFGDAIFPDKAVLKNKKLLKEIDDPESRRDIKRNIDARLKVLANQ